MRIDTLKCGGGGVKKILAFNFGDIFRRDIWRLYITCKDIWKIEDFFWTRLQSATLEIRCENQNQRETLPTWEIQEWSDFAHVLLIRMGKRSGIIRHCKKSFIKIL